jgi:hypothetical protein
MPNKPMERNLTGAIDVYQRLLLNYTTFGLSTRFEPRLTITQSAAGMMGYFADMVLDDIFVSPNFIVAEKGIYDLYMYATTTSRSGSVLFKIDGQEIIGSLDFYSPITNVTLLRVEGIVVNGYRKISIHGKVDTANPDSTGYDIMLGDMWFVKQE